MYDLSKRYVLVVEDNKMSYEAVVGLLELLDIVGIVAENGIHAVEKFTSFMREG